ncbi:17459_t:CDS:1 [Funneliformis caledonium]|uniref:17459_t:CDS:1 n=1 Tax=Funneliformis caledonium TaxID=1117310 RepID=A0A9N9ACF3_9GLOM|nr:17459_t:CDS:1 [Funneliformis caledonium]
MNKSEIHMSIFEHLYGFTVKVGMEFKAEIPSVGENGINIEAKNDQIWIFGKSTESKKTYVADFPIKVPLKAKIIATATIKKAMISVPFIMHLQSKRTGIKVVTFGTYSGIATWDLTYTLSE